MASPLVYALAILTLRPTTSRKTIRDNKAAEHADAHNAKDDGMATNENLMSFVGLFKEYPLVSSCGVLIYLLIFSRECIDMIVFVCSLTSETDGTRRQHELTGPPADADR